MAILLERLDNIARVTVQNPPMNQLDRRSRDELTETLRGLAADRSVRVLVLTGAGEQAFCAGADLRGLTGLGTEESAAAYAAAWDELYRQIRDFPAPTVAAVNGYALGGGFEILLCTDLRIAAEHARMGCTAANIGLVTSLYSLATQLPMPVAKELFYTARHITAAEALGWRLVNRVVPAAELAVATADMAEQICRRAPLAQARGKALLTLAPTLERDAHDQLQRQVFAELATTADHREGVAAFLEKRRPTFRGQ